MRRAGAIFLAVIAISGCKDDAANKPQTAASAAPTNSAIPEDLVINSFFAGGKGVEVAVDGSAGFGEPGGENGDAKLKLLDPGGDPKTKLAYNLALNKTQTIIATVGEEVTGPDVPPDQGKQPTIKMTCAITPKKKVDGGKTQVELKVAKFEVVGVDQAKVAPIAGALGKLVVSFTVAANGDTGDLDIGGGDQLPRGSESLVSMLARVQQSLYIPVPVVPVGPGAKWRSTVNAPEAAVESTYTLDGKTDAGWDVKIDTDTTAPPKVLQDPRSGKKVTIKVRGKAHYTATTLFDGPAFKMNGTSDNELAMQEDKGATRTNDEKMTLAVEKAGK